MNNTFSTKTIALCAVMCALGTVIMMLGGIIPVFTYVSPLIACLCLIPILDLYGKVPAVTTYVCTAVLSLIIDADKEAAFFYIFFGYYPIIKDIMDKIRPKVLQILAKALLFFLSESLMYFFTCNVLGMTDIIESFSSLIWVNMIFGVVMVLTMLLFDITLKKLIILYKYRVKDRLFSSFYR